MGGNIPGGNFPEGRLMRGNVLGENFPVKYSIERLFSDLGNKRNSWFTLLKSSWIWFGKYKWDTNCHCTTEKRFSL